MPFPRATLRLWTGTGGRPSGAKITAMTIRRSAQSISRAWFEDIIRIFPPMNGPYAILQLPENEASSTDYAIGADFIYASFAWSKAEPAYMTVARLAEKHQLGLFNASSSGEEVWVPKDGRMTLAHDKGTVGNCWDGLWNLLHMEQVETRAAAGDWLAALRCFMQLQSSL